MELRQLRYLAAVARHRQVTRAAEDLHVTQSALSQQVRRLEAELGVELLRRTSAGVELTPAGADLVRRAEVILSEVDRARAEVQQHAGAVRGVVRIAATTAAAAPLAAVLAGFHRDHPGVRLALRQAAGSELPGLVARASVDLAVGDPGGEELRRAAGVLATPLAPEPLVVLGADAGAANVGVGALRGRPLVLGERGTALREVVMELCAADGFSPIALLEASDPHTVRELVDAGLGVAVVPRGWAAGNAAPELAGAPAHGLQLLQPAAGTAPAGLLLAQRVVAALG